MPSRPEPERPLETPLRVAHLLRPAAGGMRQQVRSLLEDSRVSPLLCAPPETLVALADAVPESSDRIAMAIDAGAGPAEMIRAGVAAGRWARGRGAHLLHGHGLRLAPLFAAASLASGLPLVVTLHNLVPSLSLPHRLAARLALSRARRLIAVSQAVDASARRIAGGVRLSTVHNGVNTERFRPAGEGQRAAARTQLMLPPESAVVLCMARLSPEKDIGGFLEAAALAAPSAPGVRFLVAGEGSLLPTLHWQRRFLGLEKSLSFLGHRDDIPMLLAASDMLCVPSREEGLGLSALEAMAAGLPVVATRIGGLPEVVADGETGLLVPVSDPEALARALLSLLAEPEKRRAMGVAGRARVQERFSLTAMRDSTLGVYREALRR